MNKPAKEQTLPIVTLSSNPQTFQEIVDPIKIERSPLVSVLMITYNHEACIAKAIEGVVRQETDYPFELIIGEDCSTDGTRRIACQYQKRFPEKIRIIISEQNVGIYHNFQRVTNLAQGKYIAFCEGDDFWHHLQKLQKQVTFLEENSDYGLIHSNYDAVDLKSKRLFRNYRCKSGEFKDDEAYFEILALSRNIQTLTVCLRRNLFKKIVEEEKEVTDPAWPMRDMQIWLEMARLAKVKHLRESLATRHILSESASRSEDPQKTYRFRVKGRELILHYLQKYACPTEVARQAKAYTALCLMCEAYGARQYEIMESLLSDAKQYYVSIPISHRLYCYGAKNRKAFYLVKPGLFLIKAINKIKRLLGLNVDYSRLRVLPLRPQTLESEIKYQRSAFRKPEGRNRRTEDRGQ